MIPRRSLCARLLFALLLFALFLVLVNLISAQKDSSSSSQSAGGLRVVTLATTKGDVKVSLPDDMAAGDTISGTVIAEPSGKTDKDKERNAGVLNGYVIELENQKSPVSGGVMRRIALAPTLLAPSLILLDSKGKQIAAVPISVPPPAPTAPNTFDLPTLGQTGRLLQIQGPFDGDSSNTSAKIGGTDAKVIAESPRKLVVETPGNVVGPSEIKVAENGTTATGAFRNLKIDLTAPKTSLLKGESTELHVQVNGLEGITQPVQVQLQNQSPSTVNISGGNQQNIPIQPSQVTPGGTFNWSTNVTGTGNGGFVITGSLPGTTPSPTPTPVYSPQISTPEVSPANDLYASFASQDTDCCKKLINNGVLTFQDDRGNSFTIDHDKLKMVVDGKTYEWQFTQDGKPFWIEWMFCHLKDNQIVSQGTQVMAQRLQGGNSNESGGSTNISMAGPYRGETTTRTFYGFQFTGLKIGTNNKEYAVSLTLDEETCKWSFQLFAEDKTVSFSNGPPGSAAQLYNYILQNSGLHTANAHTQPAWWNAMYLLGGEIQTWNAWLATHPDADQSGSLNAAFQLWSKMVQAALDDLDKSAGDQDKQLFNQMRGLLTTSNPSPEQMKQIFWKFNDLWMRFRTGVPPK